MLDELMILARIKEGDIKAFEGIFRRYYSPLCWYAAGITGDTASAEEIVEELFYVLWKNRERLQVFQSVKSYLYRSVRNEAVQFCEHQEVKERYRASVRTESGPGYSSDPHAHLEYEELQTLIRHTLDKQPRRRQQISGCTAWRGRNMQRLPCRFVVRQDGGSGNDQGTPNLTK